MTSRITRTPDSPAESLRADVYQHFDLVDNQWCCRYCDQRFKRIPQNSSLVRHMGLLHPTEHQKGRRTKRWYLIQACYAVSSGRFHFTHFDDPITRPLLLHTLPCGKVIRAEIMRNMQAYQERIKLLFTGLDGCVIMMDKWSDRAGDTYLGIAMTGSGPLWQTTRLLGLVPCPPRSDLAALFRQVMSRYVSDLDEFVATHVICYITDGGSSERATVRGPLNGEWLHCAAHNFDLVIRDALPYSASDQYHKPVKGVLLNEHDREMHRTLFDTLHRWHMILTDMRSRSRRDPDMTKPPLPSPTRWTSTIAGTDWLYLNVSRLQELHRLTQDDEELLSDIHALYTELELVTSTLQTEFGSMMYLCTLTKYMIEDSGLQTVPMMTTMGEWIKSQLRARSRVRLGPYLEYPCVVTADVFRPKSTARLPDHVLSTLNDVRPPPRKLLPISRVESFLDPNHAVTDVEQWYLSRHGCHDVFTHFKGQNSPLAELGRTYSTLPASSAWLERLFSRCRRLTDIGPTTDAALMTYQTESRERLWEMDVADEEEMGTG